MAPAPQTPPYDRNRIREGQPFEGLSRSSPSTKGAALRPSGYLCLRPCRIQVRQTRLWNVISSLEAGTPGSAQSHIPISDAKIGKVFHG